ncbi:polyamine-modulated factor 1 [Sinocyclocheilus grahami]|uniref:polyamine-modulated factor 1 n=1 Tax=Sinocyclocheilus grahami TaxID=75366 RepID=UPI0007AC6226|nr:PREDICTED: polyamine-modulated factor 1-like [Sinocyclocheilus grahami]
MAEPEKSGGSVSAESSVDKVDERGSSRRNDSVKSSQSKPRLKLFGKVMEKSLQWLLDNASFDRFSHCFQPVSKQNPQLTEAMHKQFISQLQTLVQREISTVIEEGDLQVKLEELDRLEELAKDTPRAAWRPSGVPEQDVCSGLVSYYKKQEEYMRIQLKKVQKENAGLAQKVQAGRENITHTEGTVHPKMNRHSPDHPGLTGSQPNSNSLR